MSKKIIVAGLGHGGIAAAAQLAKAGFDVTVYEQKSEGKLGYDWTDIFAPGALKTAGIPMPPVTKFEYKENMTFYGPSERVGLTQHVPEDELEIKMERSDIYEHLINHALECGVKIVYDCKVLGPEVLGNRVVGINTEKGKFYADLIIDACGLNSPVRKQLPDSFGIEKELAQFEKISIYRAFFNKASDEPVEAKFKVCLFTDNKKGICWVASEEDHTDLLIGRFDGIDKQEVDRFAELLRQRNPRLGTEVIRGGQFVEIPVRQPLSLMVADGYAALGDSAFMTYAAKGSGIAYSLKAATILADVVQKDENGIFDADTLWEYERIFFKEIGFDACRIALAKNLLPYMTAKEVNEIFTAKLISTEELYAVLTGSFQKYKIPVLVKDKLKLLGTLPDFRSKLMNLVAWIGKFALIETSLPAKYSRDDVRKWQEKYNSFFDSVKRNDIPEVEFNQLQ